MKDVNMKDVSMGANPDLAPIAKPPYGAAGAALTAPPMRTRYDAEFEIYREIDLSDPVLGPVWKALGMTEEDEGNEGEILIGVDYSYRPGTPESRIPGRPELYDMGEAPEVDFIGFWFADTGQPVPEDFLTADEEQSFYEMVCDMEEGNWW